MMNALIVPGDLGAYDPGVIIAARRAVDTLDRVGVDALHFQRALAGAVMRADRMETTVRFGLTVAKD